MTKFDTLLHLPKHWIKKTNQNHKDCWIYWKGYLAVMSKCVTINTVDLLPIVLLHIDFFFLDTYSNCGFTMVLLIIDAKIRNLWKFSISGKKSPLTIFQFFLTQMKRTGRPVLHIRTDMGGELVGPNESCKLLHTSFQYGLYMTGGYSFWLNGKAERHIRTLENMERKTRCDTKMPKTLWCLSLDHVVNIYDSLFHSTTLESPYFLWTDRRRSIHDFRVLDCHVEALKTGKLANLEERSDTSYFMGVITTWIVIRY